MRVLLMLTVLFTLACGDDDKPKDMEVMTMYFSKV